MALTNFTIYLLSTGTCFIVCIISLVVGIQKIDKNFIDFQKMQDKIPKIPARAENWTKIDTTSNNFDVYFKLSTETTPRFSGSKKICKKLNNFSVPAKILNKNELAHLKTWDLGHKYVALDGISIDSNVSDDTFWYWYNGEKINNKVWAFGMPHNLSNYAFWVNKQGLGNSWTFHLNSSRNLDIPVLCEVRSPKSKKVVEEEIKWDNTKKSTIDIIKELKLNGSWTKVVYHKPENREEKNPYKGKYDFVTFYQASGEPIEYPGEGFKQQCKNLHIKATPARFLNKRELISIKSDAWVGATTSDTNYQEWYWIGDSTNNEVNENFWGQPKSSSYISAENNGRGPGPWKLLKEKTGTDINKKPIYTEYQLIKHAYYSSSTKTIYNDKKDTDKPKFPICCEVRLSHMD